MCVKGPRCPYKAELCWKMRPLSTRRSFTSLMRSTAVIYDLSSVCIYLGRWHIVLIILLSFCLEYKYGISIRLTLNFDYLQIDRNAMDFSNLYSGLINKQFDQISILKHVSEQTAATKLPENHIFFTFCKEFDFLIHQNGRIFCIFCIISGVGLRCPITVSGVGIADKLKAKRAVVSHSKTGMHKKSHEIYKKLCEEASLNSNVEVPNIEEQPGKLIIYIYISICWPYIYMNTS